MPGQPGNVNAVRNGSRSKRAGVVLARLGRRFAPAYIDVCRLRRAVEALLRQRHGELTLLQVARVNTACRLEQSCRACELLIRDTPTMPPEEVARQRALIVQWSQQRDNLLAALLGDGAGVADPWAALDSLRNAGQASGPGDSQAGPGAENAAGQAVGDGGQQG